MDGWMDGWMDVWMYGCMDVWMYVWMYGIYMERVSKDIPIIKIHHHSWEHNWTYIMEICGSIWTYRMFKEHVPIWVVKMMNIPFWMFFLILKLTKFLGPIGIPILTMYQEEDYRTCSFESNPWHNWQHWEVRMPWTRDQQDLWYPFSVILQRSNNPTYNCIRFHTLWKTKQLPRWDSALLGPTGSIFQRKTQDGTLAGSTAATEDTANKGVTLWVRQVNKRTKQRSHFSHCLVSEGFFLGP